DHAPRRVGHRRGQARLPERPIGLQAGRVVLLALLLLLFPAVAHAWTPATHIFLGESVLANLAQLPAWVADLLRMYPYDFLYGSIAADTSIAKKYAPVGR